MAIHNAMQNKTVPFKAVVQCTFLPGEPDKVMGYISSDADILRGVLEMTLQGYEITIRWDPKRKNYSVCLKGVTDTCANAGKWLYGNGETLQLAYGSAFYKHYVIFNEGEWNDRGTPTGGGVS